MNKYYITWGEKQYLRLAYTPMQACAAILCDFLWETFTEESVPLAFFVSYKGYESHDDDMIVHLNWVVEYLAGISPLLNDTCEKCGESNTALIKTKVALSEDSDVLQTIEVCQDCLKKSSEI